MWVRRSEYLRLVADEAKYGALVDEQHREKAELRRDLADARKDNRDLVQKILVLKREGHALGPEALDERWERYSIEEEENLRLGLAETAPPRPVEAISEPDADLADFEKQVFESIEG